MGAWLPCVFSGDCSISAALWDGTVERGSQASSQPASEPVRQRVTAVLQGELDKIDKVGVAAEFHFGCVEKQPNTDPRRVRTRTTTARPPLLQQGFARSEACVGLSVAVLTGDGRLQERASLQTAPAPAERRSGSCSAEFLSTYFFFFHPFFFFLAQL